MGISYANELLKSKLIFQLTQCLSADTEYKHERRIALFSMLHLSGSGTILDDNDDEECPFLAMQGGNLQPWICSYYFYYSKSKATKDYM